MTVTQLMAGYTPSALYEGIATNDDFVLAIDTSSDGTEDDPKEYTVVQGGVANVDAQLSAETKDSTYIRTGKMTSKTATQRTFKLSGDRIFGDEFQDFALSHAIKFGKGQACVRGYVYFSLLTGVGEEGSATIIVNSDGSGEASNNAEIDIEIMTTKTPEEYKYSTT